MSVDLSTQLRAYGDLLDDISPGVSPARPRESGDSRIGRLRRPRWSSAVMAAAVIVAALVVALLLRGGVPDVAVDEDESLSEIGVILEYVNAVNEGDIARQRELTDPESVELASVFDDQ